MLLTVQKSITETHYVDKIYDYCPKDLTTQPEKKIGHSVTACCSNFGNMEASKLKLNSNFATSIQIAPITSQAK